MSYPFSFAADTPVWLDPNGRISATLQSASILVVAGVEDGNSQALAELLASGKTVEAWRLNHVALEYTLPGTDNHAVYGGHAIPIDRGSSSVSSSVSSSASASVSSSVSSSASSSVSSSVSHSVSSSVSSSASASSDSRLKANIVPLENVLSKLIRGVGFTWNLDAAAVGKTPGARDVGVIAQEVEQVFPELVSTDEAGYKRVNYNGLVGVLLAAVAELHAKVVELERPRSLAAGA